MRKHIFKTSNIFFIYKKNIQNMLEYWPYAWKQNIFFFNKHFFCWRKPGILIPDLYLYNIKIQTDIDQNTVIKLPKNHKFFEIILKEFLFFNIFLRAGPSGAHVAGLNPAGLMWTVKYVWCEQWISFHCSRELYLMRTVKCKEMVHAQRRKGCKPGGRNDVEDDGEHSQWCWWRWRGSRRGLPMVLTVELIIELCTK